MRMWVSAEWDVCSLGLDLDVGCEFDVGCEYCLFGSAALFELYSPTCLHKQRAVGDETTIVELAFSLPGCCNHPLRVCLSSCVCSCGCGYVAGCCRLGYAGLLLLDLLFQAGVGGIACPRQC